MHREDTARSKKSERLVLVGWLVLLLLLRSMYWYLVNFTRQMANSLLIYHVVFSSTYESH